MVLLALDTSTQHAIVAAAPLADDARTVFRAERVTTHSERLMAIIDELFRELGVAPRTLTLVACAAGPGSFTGLRIGLATGKGLCLGTGAKLALLPSLEVRAALAPSGARVVAAIDAFRGEIYAGLFTIDGAGRPVATGAPFTATPEALRARVAAFAPTHAVGDGFARYPDALPAGAHSIALEPRALAEALLRLGRDRDHYDDPRTATPLYVRTSAPEEAKP